MRTLAEADLLLMLQKVGLNPVPATAMSMSFEDLDLDSLARIETATRIEEAYGVQIEERLTAGLTPGGLLDLVNGELAVAGR
jgi:acyl carrier protein